MSNPFFTAFGGGSGAQPQPIQNGGISGLIDAARQFRSNPMQFLLQKKLNVPAEIMNNPDAILNHLVQTGQVSQDRVNASKQQLYGLQNFRR